MDLIGDSAEGVGYLLKERVGDVETFTDAVARVAGGGSALDPEVIGRMLGRRRSSSGPLQQLTEREREVLAQIAEGKSNLGLAKELVVTTAAVEKHVTNIFTEARDRQRPDRATPGPRRAHLPARVALEERTMAARTDEVNAGQHEVALALLR